MPMPGMSHEDFIDLVRRGPLLDPSLVNAVRGLLNPLTRNDLIDLIAGRKIQPFEAKLLVNKWWHGAAIYEHKGFALGLFGLLGSGLHLGVTAAAQRYYLSPDPADQASYMSAKTTIDTITAVIAVLTGTITALIYQPVTNLIAHKKRLGDRIVQLADLRLRRIREGNDVARDADVQFPTVDIIPSHRPAFDVRAASRVLDSLV